MTCEFCGSMGRKTVELDGYMHDRTVTVCLMCVHIMFPKEEALEMMQKTLRQKVVEKSRRDEN